MMNTSIQLFVITDCVAGMQRFRCNDGIELPTAIWWSWPLKHYISRWYHRCSRYNYFAYHQYEKCSSIKTRFFCLLSTSWYRFPLWLICSFDELTYFNIFGSIKFKIFPQLLLENRNKQYRTWHLKFHSHLLYW